MNDEEIRQHVRRLAGFAALRRIRKIVDTEEAAESRNAFWAKRIALVITLLAVLFIGGLWLLRLPD
jgi:hypothetical protein